MVLSDIAYAVPRATVASMLALRATNPAACRTAIVTAIKNKFPSVTITLADLTSGKIAIVDYPQLGYVGFGRGPYDAIAACEAAWRAANPGATLPVAAG